MNDQIYIYTSGISACFAHASSSARVMSRSEAQSVPSSFQTRAGIPCIGSSRSWCALLCMLLSCAAVLRRRHCPPPPVTCCCPASPVARRHNGVGGCNGTHARWWRQDRRSYHQSSGRLHRARVSQLTHLYRFRMPACLVLVETSVVRSMESGPTIECPTPCSCISFMCAQICASHACT